jgi:ABC-type multidrug transport system fused ATPase/permease subunit
VRRALRTTGALLGLGWSVAPGLLSATAARATVGALASVGYTAGFRLVVDAAGRGDRAGVVVGVVVVAVLFTLGWALTILGASRGSVLTDRANLMLGERIGRLAGALPGVAVFERPEDLRRLDQLRAQRRQLAAAPRQLIGAWQVVLRAGAMVGLLATVYPPVLVVPLFALAPALAARRAARVLQRSDDALADDLRLADELFALSTDSRAARDLRTYGIAAPLAARHAALGEAIRRRALRGALHGAAWEALGWLVFAAAFVAAIVALVLRAAHGDASPGGVVMAVSLMRRTQTQVARGSDSAMGLSAAMQTAAHLRWLEDRVAAERPPRTARRPPERLQRGIVLDGVSFAYLGAATRVLRGVDLELPAGATVALVGENGAGKTTLVKLLTGMYRPTDGVVRVDGVDLAELALDAWRARTTATFQDHQRFALLLRETAGIGDLPGVDDRDAVLTALGRAGGQELVARVPRGLDTQLGRPFGGVELSGGQWQRLALARGLMRQDPLLIVLDEPTAALDAAAERALFERYARAARAGAAARGAITLLVTHRFSSARAADHIVVLEGGAVVETGHHDALVRAGGRYAELHALLARSYDR